MLCQGRFQGCSPGQQERVLWSLLMWVRRVRALEPSTDHCQLKEIIGGIFIPRNITTCAPEVGSGSLKLEKHQRRLAYRAKNLDCVAQDLQTFSINNRIFFFRLCEPCIHSAEFTQLRHNDSAVPSWCWSSTDNTERNGHGYATVNLILQKQTVGHSLLLDVEMRLASRPRTLETPYGTCV